MRKLQTVLLIALINRLTLNKYPVFTIATRRYKRYLSRGCSSIDFQCTLFTNIFAIKISGDADSAHIIATNYGFQNLGPIWGLNDHYEFVHPKIRILSRRRNSPVANSLNKDERVMWFEQQKVNYNGMRTIDELFVANNHYTHQLYKKQDELVFNDPLYKKQWYILGEGVNGYDMNVVNAWKQGYTGRGVVVTVVDDGVQADHPDLIRNFDTMASIDLLDGHMDHPLPNRSPYKHGTNCAGEIASEPNNHICGVGIAFNAKIGGIRLLDTMLTDSKEARALSFKNNYIDVYSSSWGPKDNGKALGGPGKLARKALVNGIKSGRNGLGVIYVWAAGNGGRNGDNCNADSYANSVYTITVSSANRRGRKPWYDEECSSIIASTFSSGSNKSAIVTTEYAPALVEAGDTSKNICTIRAGGTSASAPIAAAMCALVLQANPTVTWRDMQHIIVATSRYEPLKSETGWIRNAAGFLFSHKFGFGLMDASEMVSLAKEWQTVPPLKTCKTKVYKNVREIHTQRNSKIEVIIKSSNCRKRIKYLEYVEAVLTITFKPRGNLEILLTSKSGTTAEMMKPRPKDVTGKKFLKWSFTAICFWGESVSKRWNLTIVNRGPHEAKEPGKLIDYQLVFHGF